MSKRRSARLDPSVADVEGNSAKRKKENDAGDSDPKRTSDASAKTKQATKGKNSSPRTKAKSTARPASKAAPQRGASRAPVKTSKPPITSQANYMGTLDGVAPPVDSPASESKKGIVLNEEEINADLGDDMGEEGEDVLEIMDSDEEKNKGGLNSDEEADENSFSEIDHDNDHDMAEFYDNMDIEDITKPTRKKRTSLSASANGFSTSSKAKGKILETDFEDVQLARLAKSSVRLAICVDDMWPQEDKPSLKLLRNELGKMRNKDRLASLRKVTQSAEEKDKLIRFMNYASSQVRFDMSLPTRLLVTEYFQLSGGKGQPGAEEVVECCLQDLRF
ncbi:hypothetical protein F5880DRAFT_1617802 [Lentinula raphanica]|nr:hypothetical protein F5880DRAFT_1617802 [Lentinula raphanica]